MFLYKSTFIYLHKWNESTIDFEEKLICWYFLKDLWLLLHMLYCKIHKLKIL
jgi:hypothetical protein